MSPSASTFLRHDAQESGETEILNSLHTIEDTGADRPNMVLQPARDPTGQSHRFGTSDAENHYSPMGFEQRYMALPAPQQPLPPQLAWGVHTTNAPDTASISNGTPASMFGQPIGLDHTSTNAFPHYSPATTKDTTLGDFSAHTNPIDNWDCRHSRNTLLGYQEQCQPTATESGTIDSGQDVGTVGSVLRNRRFACDEYSCIGITFSRCAELWRHYETFHDPHRESFWCHVTTCKRNMSNGGQPFKRSDKLEEHIRRMHDRD